MVIKPFTCQTLICLTLLVTDEKSAQVQYTYDFGVMKVPGLTWTSPLMFTVGISKH